MTAPNGERSVRGRSSFAHLAFSLCGASMVALGLYFVFLRPPLLPEDLRYFGVTLTELESVAPQLLPWLRQVFTAMGGYIFATGVLTTFVARIPPAPLTTTALALAGAASVVLMSAVNFAIDSDYKWLMLLPALLWTAGMAALFLNRPSLTMRS